METTCSGEGVLTELGTTCVFWHRTITNRAIAKATAITKGIRNLRAAWVRGTKDSRRGFSHMIVAPAIRIAKTRSMVAGKSGRTRTVRRCSHLPTRERRQGASRNLDGFDHILVRLLRVFHAITYVVGVWSIDIRGVDHESCHLAAGVVCARVGEPEFVLLVPGSL